MKLSVHTLISFMFLFGVYFSASAAPDYTDYVPKYRSQNKNFMLTKIEYTTSEMILHFRYVASREEEIIYFPGSSRSTAWKLYTSGRSGSELTKYATLENITINGELKSKKIEAGDEPSFVARYGEVIRGEAHFGRLPGNVKAINFKASTLAICSDILVKDEDSPMLGTVEQMEGSVERFDKMLTNLGITVVPEPTQNKSNLGIANNAEAKEEDLSTENAVKDEIIVKAQEPITYTPQELNSSEDLDCNKRVILKNVYFDDNSASYAGRVNALKTIQVIVDYMNYYPQAMIILHGHSDVLGDQIRSFELSKERVLAVRNSLVLRGIDNDRIRTIAHGSKQPLPKFENGGKKNRRVEVELICRD
ncbi:MULTISPECIES: OmpA family protein [unclassified Aureispira]|uniref:OmpA family protein n=1 Tax=unclassified Aureispira TaxID=2649989 RepID=UPI00069868C0|nr:MULTISPECIES: OmpA family protein [unclassified Aureispira]WMX12490.1 OmpA family protein [Aureispira sp. CCB-E]